MEQLTREEARVRKYLKFYSGKPCKNGHLAMRYTSSNKCLVCVSIQSAFWYRANDKKNRTKVPLKVLVYPSQIDTLLEFCKSLNIATELKFLMEDDNARRNARIK